MISCSLNAVAISQLLNLYQHPFAFASVPSVRQTLPASYLQKGFFFHRSILPSPQTEISLDIHFNAASPLPSCFYLMSTVIVCNAKCHIPCSSVCYCCPFNHSSSMLLFFFLLFTESDYKETVSEGAMS